MTFSSYVGDGNNNGSSGMGNDCGGFSVIDLVFMFMCLQAMYFLHSSSAAASQHLFSTTIICSYTPRVEDVFKVYVSVIT
ncbi:unnamed protein product [Prunus armeniaca]